MITEHMHTENHHRTADSRTADSPATAHAINPHTAGSHMPRSLTPGKRIPDTANPPATQQAVRAHTQRRAIPERTRIATSLGASLPADAPFPAAANLPGSRAIRMQSAPSHSVRLRGVSQTMLQTLAIRAFRTYDALAMSLLRRLDYDFSTAAHDEALSQAVVARTLALDSLTASYVAAYPHGVVVNLAAGLDTRFHRLHTADVTWFNVDLPDVADARARLLGHSKNLFDIAADATTDAWAQAVQGMLAQRSDGKASRMGVSRMPEGTPAPQPQSQRQQTQQPVLVLMEGLSMYLDDDRMRRIMEVTADAFPHVMFVAEALTPHAATTAVMPSIQATGSRFTWGASHGAAMQELEPRLRWSADVPLENRGHYLAILTR